MCIKVGMNVEQLLNEVRSHRQRSAENVKRIVEQAAHVRHILNCPKQSKTDSVGSRFESVAGCSSQSTERLSSPRPLSHEEHVLVRLGQLRVTAVERENESLRTALSSVAHDRHELLGAAAAAAETVAVLRRADDIRSGHIKDMRLRITQAQRTEERHAHRLHAASAELAAERSKSYTTEIMAATQQLLLLLRQEEDSRLRLAVECDAQLQASSATLLLERIRIMEVLHDRERLAAAHEKEFAEQTINALLQETKLQQQLNVVEPGPGGRAESRCSRSPSPSLADHPPLTLEHSCPRTEKLAVVVGELEQQLEQTRNEVGTVLVAKRELQLRLANELVVNEELRKELEAVQQRTAKLLHGHSSQDRSAESGSLLREVAVLHRSVQTALDGRDVANDQATVLRLQQELAKEQRLRLEEQGRRICLEQTAADLRTAITCAERSAAAATGSQSELTVKCQELEETIVKMREEIRDLSTVNACQRQELTTASAALVAAKEENNTLSERVSVEVETARRALSMHARLHAAEAQLRVTVAEERRVWDEERSKLALEQEHLLASRLAQHLRESVVSPAALCLSSSCQTDGVCAITAEVETRAAVHHEAASHAALLMAERSHSAWLLGIAEAKDAENASMQQALQHLVKTLRSGLLRLGCDDSLLTELQQKHRLHCEALSDRTTSLQEGVSAAALAEAYALLLLRTACDARDDREASRSALEFFLCMHKQLDALLADEEVGNAVSVCQEVLLTTLDPLESEDLRRDLSLDTISLASGRGESQIPERLSLALSNLPVVEVRSAVDSWPKTAHRVFLLCLLVKHHQSEFTKIRKALFDLKAAFLAEADARMEAEQRVMALSLSKGREQPTCDTTTEDFSLKRTRLLEIAEDAIAALNQSRACQEQALHAAQRICGGSESSPVVQQLYDALENLRAAIGAAHACGDWILESYLGIVSHVIRR